MPKIRTKKGLAKRFKITKRGKIKRLRAGRSHLLSKKSRKRKRQLKKPYLVSHSEKKTLRMLLGR